MNRSYHTNIRRLFLGLLLCMANAAYPMSSLIGTAQDLNTVRNRIGTKGFVAIGAVCAFGAYSLAQCAKSQFTKNRMIGACCIGAAGYLGYQLVRRWINAHSKQLADVIARLGRLEQGQHELSLNVAKHRDETEAGFAQLKELAQQLLDSGKISKEQFEAFLRQYKGDMSTILSKLEQLVPTEGASANPSRRATRTSGSQEVATSLQRAAQGTFSQLPMGLSWRA